MSDQPRPAQLKLGQQDFEIIEQQRMYDGFFKIDRYTFRHRLFNGTWGEPLQREVFERGEAVGVLLYDSAGDGFILVEQIRAGALKGQNPWQLEVVAGMMDGQESPLSTAVREIKEETGLDIAPGAIHPVLSYYSSCGGSTEKLHLYWAETPLSAQQRQALDGATQGMEQENEDIRVCWRSRQALQQDLAEQRIENAATLIALQWFLLRQLTDQAAKIKPATEAR